MRRVGQPLWVCVLVFACAWQTQAAAPSACGEKVAHGMQSGTLRSGVLERSYQVYVPKRWNNQAVRPMVLGLHGGYGSGEIFNQQTRASEQADKYNMLLVLPDGYYKSWNAGTCCKPAARLGVRDVRFIENLIDRISQDYCVDRSTVFATGFSNGAMLAHRIACEKPGLLKGIAPVAGGIMSACENAGAVATLMISGKDDPRIFWNGGEFDGSYRPSMQELLASLIGRNECSSKEVPVSQSSAQAHCRVLQSCRKAPLRYCGLDGVGHQWPGGKSFWPDKLGPNTRSFDASAEIFEFFSGL